MRALRDLLLAPAIDPADRRRARMVRGGGAMNALRDFLLTPPAAGPIDDARALPAAASVAVAAPACLAILCAPGDARALGVAAAALLARRHRAPCGLACVWTASPPGRDAAASRPPAGRAARRLAAALAARGLDAAACGRVAAVALAPDPVEAGGTIGRAIAAAGAAPAVLVLGGPREEAFEPLLADCDRILVLARAGGDDVLASLALAGLGPLAGRAAAATVTLGPAARALAAAGLAVPPALRRALVRGPEAAR